MADHIDLPTRQTQSRRKTGVVLQLVKASNKDTIEALEWLLHEARKGEFSGITATFRRPDGEEAGLSTGVYKAHPELVLMAALRFSAAVTLAKNGSDT